MADDLLNMKFHFRDVFGWSHPLKPCWRMSIYPPEHVVAPNFDSILNQRLRLCKKWRTLESKAYILFKCRRKVYYVILCKTSYPWAWRTLIALTGLSKLIWPCNVNIDDSKIFCQPILLDVSDLPWFFVALRKLHQYYFVKFSCLLK